MKFTKRQIELLTEIRNLAANLNSAAEDLRFETEYESPDLDDLIGTCEYADSMVSDWFRETETGQAADAGIEKLERQEVADQMAATAKRKTRRKAAKRRWKAA
jgi:hypothetical protein